MDRNRIKLENNLILSLEPFGSIVTRKMMRLDRDSCAQCEMYPMTLAKAPVVLALSNGQQGLASTFCCREHAEQWRAAAIKREPRFAQLTFCILNVGDKLPWPRGIQ